MEKINENDGLRSVAHRSVEFEKDVFHAHITAICMANSLAPIQKLSVVNV